MRSGRPFQVAAIKEIGRMERDSDAFFGEQEIGDFLPGFAPLAQFTDELEMRFQDAVMRPAATLPVFIHHRPG